MSPIPVLRRAGPALAFTAGVAICAVWLSPQARARGNPLRAAPTAQPRQLDMRLRFELEPRALEILRATRGVHYRVVPTP